MRSEQWKRIIDDLIFHHLPLPLILLAIEKIKRGEVYESAWPERPAFKRVESR